VIIRWWLGPLFLGVLCLLTVNTLPYIHNTPGWMSIEEPTVVWCTSSSCRTASVTSCAETELLQRRCRSWKGYTKMWRHRKLNCPYTRHGVTAPLIYDLGIIEMWMVKLTTRQFAPQKKCLYPLTRNLGGPRSRFGLFNDIYLTFAGIRSLITVLLA